MTEAIYTQPQALDKNTIITASKTQLFLLCGTIFANRDFKNVEKEIADASMIRFGLLALNQVDITFNRQQAILVTLTKLCNIYNQQTIPTIN